MLSCIIVTSKTSFSFLLDRTLIIGTGMWQPNIPKVKGIEYADGYETVSTDASNFEGQSVLILG